MEGAATNIAESLLKIKAVRLEPANPFTWASGWKSPVYCDNRRTLSYPALRSLIRDALVAKVREAFPGATGVAGVATAGIPQGALVADALGLPFIYIRSKAKGHGLANQIEGQMDPALSYVVVEDLVSTGGSSLKAVDALREAGGTVAGVISIFNYGFPQASEAFEAAGVPCESLLDLEVLLGKAVEIAYISPLEMEVVSTWRKDPANWSPSSQKGQ